MPLHLMELVHASMNSCFKLLQFDMLGIDRGLNGYQDKRLGNLTLNFMMLYCLEAYYHSMIRFIMFVQWKTVFDIR